MGFKLCATKPHSNLDDYEFSYAIKKYLDLPTKPQSSLDDYELSSTIKKYLDLLASFSFSRSISSSPRHQLSSSYRSKDLLREKVINKSFENMPIFHDGPIFDRDENDKNGPR